MATKPNSGPFAPSSRDVLNLLEQVQADYVRTHTLLHGLTKGLVVSETAVKRMVDGLAANGNASHDPVARLETGQHEILEGTQARAFVDGDDLSVTVNCRAEAGALADEVPYALAVTLEVAEEIGITIYDEIRTRVHARVRIEPPQ